MININEIQILKKISKYNNMTTFTLTEKYDISNAAKLLNTKLLDDETKGSLKKYLKKGKGGKVEVNYTQNEIGRLNIKVKGLKEKETCMASSFMKGIMKASLFDKNYMDLDIVNAHPVFALHTFKNLNYTTDKLEQYIHDRDSLFADLMNQGLCRDKSKILIMRLMYGGSVSAFMREYNVKKLPDYLYDLEKEFIMNRKLLLQRDELLEYRMKAKEEKGDNYYNVDGTAFSYFLQTIECSVLMSMFRKLKQLNYRVGALIHDGLHLEKNENLDIQSDIPSIIKHIKKELDIDIELKIKKFNVPTELNEIIIVETDKEGGDYISDKIKHDYITCNNRKFMRINNVWTENDKTIKTELMNATGDMNIFCPIEDKEGNIKLCPYSTMAKHARDMINFVKPTDDEDFIDKLWTSNLYKLCFRNGYYDFKTKTLKPYDNETHTTIKINRDYEAPDPETIKEVYEKILNPIFNNDKEIMNVWINYIARGLAGHVEDKNWAVGIGERDCGKGVLGGLLENAFGEYVRSTNSENFMYKSNGGDSAKALSWLVPYEFKRLLLTNEITTDSQDTFKINGNVLKKLSSGGDKIEARVNHKDEINFRIQARVCMFCNDLPPIEPADTKETSYMFRFPSKFLAPDDDRLGKPVMKPNMYLEDDEVKYVLDNEGHKTYSNICNFYKKDDSIKEWCKQPEVLNAFQHILFSAYQNKLPLPNSMKEDMDDFKEEEKEEDKFYELFKFRGDKDFEEEDIDFVSISQINFVLKNAHINLSAQKYKNYLQTKGCIKGKRLNAEGKRTNCWTGLQLTDRED
tara:strand:+ start:1123 stop:3525 length:2403 start_codon:yes stop_codon:yes gene_type:complete